MVAFLVVAATYLGPSYLVASFLVASFLVVVTCSGPSFLVAACQAASYQAVACLVAFGVPYRGPGPFLALESWQDCKLEGPLEQLLDCRQVLLPYPILEEPSLAGHHWDWVAGPKRRNPLPQAMAHTGA